MAARFGSTDLSLGFRPSRRWSLGRRLRTAVFAALFTGSILALYPVVQRLLSPALEAVPGWSILVAGAGLAILLVLVSTIAHLAEGFVFRAMHELRHDVRRAVVAEEGGRRGASFLLSDPDEPVEVAQLREQVRALHGVMQARLEDEQRWVGSAVHDAKAGLVGLTYMLDCEQGQDPVTASIQLARDEARRLVVLMSRLTDVVRFSKLAAVERQEIDVGALIGRIRMKLAARTAAGAHVRIEVESAGGKVPVIVLGDEALLERAFTNLIDNALRIARTRVKVSVFANLVRFEDDGPGLTQDLAILTQPFRSETVTISGVPVPAGTLGLGLFIARRVLEAHGGRLAVERTSGEGTVLLAYLGTGR